MIYDLIIIGGGPAGITAGIYAARKKVKTLLITKDFSGQMGQTSEIDNWPGAPELRGLDLVKKFEEHLKKFEIEIVQGEEVRKVEKSKGGFKVKTGTAKEFSAKAVIVATGSDPRPLEVEGEKEFIGHGLSYCSTCDAPFFKNKQVAVIGGGNAGFEAALDLVKYAKKVFILEHSERAKADELLQGMAEQEKKIEVLFNKELKKIEGRGKIEDIVYQDTKTKKTFQVPMEGVFVQIGTIPATGFLKGLCGFNERDEIKVDFKTCQTSTPGLFAAGDVNDGRWKQVVIAAGEGARAALAAYEYLQKN